MQTSKCRKYRYSYPRANAKLMPRVAITAGEKATSPASIVIPALHTWLPCMQCRNDHYWKDHHTPGKAGDDPATISAGAVTPYPTAEAGKTAAREAGEAAKRKTPYAL